LVRSAFGEMSSRPGDANAAPCLSVRVSYAQALFASIMQVSDDTMGEPHNLILRAIPRVFYAQARRLHPASPGCRFTGSAGSGSELLTFHTCSHLEDEMKTTAIRGSLAFLALTLAAIAALAQAPQTDYAHMTMKVDKLANNFYTVTGMNGSGRTGGAIGVLTGPDGIFMVDATFGPLTGKVTAAIKTFSNEPIKFLVNTHPHGDHTGGNPNLAKMGVTILGRREMRADLMAQKGFDQAGVPTVIFNGPLTLYMDGDEAVIIPVPPAHTDADSMVYFRKADVLMIGDFFRAGYPNIGGTVNGMIRALGMAIGVCGPNTKVVPGHGPVMTREDVIAHKDMLVNVSSRVSDLIKQGKSEDEVVAAHPTASYDALVLDGIAQYYDQNTIVRYRNGDAFVKQLYEQLKPKS